jgi:parallel beta-helix repeat protein
MQQKSLLASIIILLLAVLLMGNQLNSIGPVKAYKGETWTGTVYIRANGDIDPADAPVQRNGDFYILTGNIISGYYGIVIQRNGMTLDGAGYTVQGTSIKVGNDGVYLNGSNVMIKNVQIRTFWHGITLESSSNHNSIFGNNISNNAYAILCDFSSYNKIYGNEIKNNRYGISLFSSSYNIIMGNNITANTGDGFGLKYSSNYNSISGNDIIANTGDGFRLEYSSNYNSISGNNIVASGMYGIQFYWTNIDYASFNNKISHNNFIQNAWGQFYSQELPNIWDDGYPSGGNYWSDYNGTDSNYDGIGDSNYTIDVNNIDRYPLMGMFSDFNATSEQHVQTVCNSTIANFDFNGTAILFDVTGQSGTAGFCRICMPRALMDNPYEIFVNGTKVLWHEVSGSYDTHAYLYFNYTHSTQEVIILPEYQSFPILPLFMMITLIAIVAYKKRRLD